jgi:NAD(P)-dependent dehydrogenase (short-subunit alcohol dehydrogenase family)
MFDLTKKKVLITGSTQGIGKEIARCLAGHGARVFIHGRSSFEKCMRVCEEIGGEGVVMADLGEEGCAEKLYNATGNIDILILNASIQYRTPWNEIKTNEFDEQIRVNLKSTLEIIQRYVPDMEREQFGRIITVGSVQQYKPHKDMAVYAASKCAQMSLAQNLAKQLAPVGITVNNITPGVMATPRNEKALSDKTYREMVLDKVPMGFVGQPEDCAGAALLLCSEAGSYITGIDLIVDGGMQL